MNVSRCELCVFKIGLIDEPFLLIMPMSFYTICSWKDTPKDKKRSDFCLVFLCRLDLKNPLFRGKIGLMNL